MLKRLVALGLIVLVSLPGGALPTTQATACAMQTAMTVESCDYCVPTAANDTAPTLEAGCCRYLPNSEATPAQAGSVGSTPRPAQTPDIAAIVPGISAVGEPPCVQIRALRARAESPPSASSTKTTHLLL